MPNFIDSAVFIDLRHEVADDCIVIRSESDAEIAKAALRRRQEAKAASSERAEAGSGESGEAAAFESAEAGSGESGEAAAFENAEAGSGESGEAAQSALSFRSDSESSNVSDFITEFHITKGKMPIRNAFLDNYNIEHFWSLKVDDKLKQLHIIHDNPHACYLVAAIAKTLNKCYPYMGLECPSIYKVVAFANVVHGILSPLDETEVENMCQCLDIVSHIKGWHLLLYTFYEQNNIAHLKACAYINYMDNMRMKHFENVKEIHEKKMIVTLYEKKDETALFKLYKMLKACRLEWGCSEDDSVLETSKVFFQCSADCCLALKLIHYLNNGNLILRRSDQEWRRTFRKMLYYYCPDWCQGVEIKGVKVEQKDFEEQRKLTYIEMLERFDENSAPTLEAREEQEQPVKFKDEDEPASDKDAAGDEPVNAAASTDSGGKRSRSEIAQDDERESIYRRGSSAWRVLRDH